MSARSRGWLSLTTKKESPPRSTIARQISCWANSASPVTSRPSSDKPLSSVRAAVISLPPGGTRSSPITPWRLRQKAASRCTPGPSAVRLPRSRLPSSATWLSATAAPALRTQAAKPASRAATSRSQNT